MKTRVDAIGCHESITPLVTSGRGFEPSLLSKLLQGGIAFLIAAFSLATGFTITTPTFDLRSGTYPTFQSVQVTTPDTNVTLHYTVDVSTPTTNSPQVPSDGLVLISQSTTLKAAGFSGATSGPVGTNAYIISGQISSTVGNGFTLRADGTLWGAGTNNNGELGVGNYNASTNQVQITNIPSNILLITGGYWHMLALDRNGSLWTWGYNGEGELGIGNPGDDSIQTNIPTQVTTLGGNVQAMAGGAYHSLAVASNGVVWSWGYNALGALGTGGTNPSYVPVRVANLTNITAVAAGAYHSLALDGSSNVWGWGDNSSGEIGQTNMTFYTLPQLITGISNVVAISCGEYHSLFLKADGTVWACGNNGSYQLGNSTVTNSYSSVPVQVNGLSNVVDITSGYWFNATVKSDGTVWAWGDNSYRSLGSIPPQTNYSPTPIQATNINPVTAVSSVSSQGYHTLAGLSNGMTKGWGENDNGSLALPTTVFTNLPTVSSFLVFVNNQLPPPPSNLIVNYNGQNQAILTWNEAGVLTQSFTIQESMNGGAWTTIDTISGNVPYGTTSTYQVNGLIKGVTYSFQVIANSTYSTQGSLTNPAAVASPLISVMISADTNGFVAPANLTITATTNATPTNGSISRVDFYEGSHFLGSTNATNNTYNGYSLTLSNVAAGPHTYTAIAYDTNSNEIGEGNGDVTVTVPPIGLATGVFYNLLYSSNDSGESFTSYPLNTYLYIQSVDGINGVGVQQFTSNSWAKNLNLPTVYFNQNFFGNSFLGPYSDISPMASFGAAAGGTPLYTGQTYTFAFCGGGLPNNTTNFAPYTNPALSNYNAADFQILVYNKNQFTNGATNVQPIYTNYFSLPHQGTTNWDAFTSKGFVYTNVLSAVGTNGYSLTTTVQYNLGANNQSFSSNGNAQVQPLIITHSSTNSQYYYMVNFRGVIYDINGIQYPITVTDPSDNPATNATYSYGYTLDFTQQLPWVSTSLNMPGFQGQPLPAAYSGKSIDELLQMSQPVTYQFTTNYPTNPIYTNLDNSPELRTNAILDKFVDDMGGATNPNTPIILANYILNHIHLCDAISYNVASGGVSDKSINEGGVNRSAVATFLEEEGNPAEQCALLVYFLRKCGVPCAYVFPTQDTLQMLDARMSSLLHTKLAEALPNTNNTAQILPVNYPWVAAYDTNSQQWVHIFPWMKDTQITEGDDLSDYLPLNFQTGLQFVQHYLTNDPALTNLISDTNDDSLLTLYPLWVNQYLTNNGVTTNDVGLTIVDRPHNYTNWSDFPQPWGLAKNGVGATNLVTNLSAFTNIFDTIDVQVFSDRSGSGAYTNGDPVLDTGVMRMVDLHNRMLLISTASSSNNTNSQSIYLEPLRPSGNDGGTTNFTGGSLINAQLISTNLTALDNQLYVNFTYTRHANQQTNLGGSFLGVEDTQTYSPGPRPLMKGDAAVLVLDYGMVTPAMINADAQKFWTAQQNGTLTNDTNTAIGTQLQLMGMSYYKHCSDLRQIIEPLHKTTVASFFGAGLSKLQAIRTVPQNTLPSNGLVTLTYPAVDMFSINEVYIGNETVSSSNGISQANTFDDNYALLVAGGSAEEHMTLNEFYSVKDSASTVHLLHDAITQRTTNPNLILTSDNFQSYATNVYILTNGSTLTTNTLQGWAGGAWSSISNVLTTPVIDTNGTYFASNNIVYITPGPIICASKTYAGVGAFVFSSGSSVAAYITMQSFIINGAFSAPPSANYQNIFTPVNIASYAYLNLNDNGTARVTFNQPTTASQNVINSATLTTAVPYYPSQLSSGTAFLTFDQQQLVQQASGNNTLSASGATTSSFVKSFASTGIVSSITTWLGNLGKLASDPVDVIRGSYYINDADLTIPGPFQIQFSRNYDSQNLANNEFGTGWKMGYFAYLATNAYTNLIYAAEMDGSVIAYSQQSGSTNTWIPMTSNNPSLCNQKGDAIGGTANPFNNQIVLSISGGTTNYTLSGADGSVRLFTVTSYPLGTGSNTIIRQRPYLKTWKDAQGNNLSFGFGSNPANTDYGFLNRITANNGNFLQLDYDTYGHIISANSGDGRIVSYGYDNYGDLVGVTRPDNSSISYTYLHSSTNSTPYSTHLITQVTKPGGRVLVNSYDGARRVSQQQASVGGGGSSISMSTTTFGYVNSTNSDGTITGATQTTNALGGVTTYSYTSGLITMVVDAANATNTTGWYFPGNTNAGAYPRSMANSVDKRGLGTTYSYDTNGNLITMMRKGSDGLTGTTTYSYNTNNLPTNIALPIGNTETITYDSTYNYLPSSVTMRASGGTVNSTVNTYTASGSIKGLLQQVVQDGATTSYTYDGRGYPASETHQGGGANVTYTLSYNARGQLTSKTDSAGQESDYAYDDLGNQIWAEKSDTDGNRVWWNYNYYNANGEIEWTQGAHYNPCDYTETIYDAAGHPYQKLVWTSQASGWGVTAGPVATTTYTYDNIGHLIQVLDPIGTKSVITPDALGRPLTITKTGTGVSSSETFTYEPGGKVASHTDVLGGQTSTSYTLTGLPSSQTNADRSTQTWTYLTDGRISTEGLPNGTTKTYSYNDAAHQVTEVTTGGATKVSTCDARGNLLSTTINAGYLHSYTYDALNRLTSESGPQGGNGFGLQSITHSYDAAGLSQTDVNSLGEATVTSFDALHQPLEVDTYGAMGNIVHTTSYQYTPDHSGVTVTQGNTSDSTTPAGVTTYRDFAGRELLVVKQGGERITSTYDLNENLTSRLDELNRQTSYTYDGFNHPLTTILPGGGKISYVTDDAGNITTETMPGGVTWNALYDTAGRITNETPSSLGGGSFTYNYYTNGAGSIGKLQRKVTPVGTISYSYDGLGRLTSESATDVTRTYGYDVRDLLTSVSENYSGTAANYSNSVTRALDGYGAIYTETIKTNGVTREAWALNHDAAGRTTLLSSSALPYTFSYDAVGHIVEADFNQNQYYYGYQSDGRLYSRTTPNKSQTLTRDNEGRILSSTQTLGGNSLNESLTWLNDSTQSQNIITRVGNTTNNLNYTYDVRDHLLTQSFISGNTAKYQFDGGAITGIGLLTSTTITNNLTGVNTATYDGYDRLTNNSLSGTLTNTIGTPVAQSYDAAGRVTNRTQGGVTDTLTWDTFGELIQVVRTGSSNNFTWSAAYDGLGRRLQTTQGTLVVQSSYNPEHEFLELCTTVNGTKYWHVQGPDLNGVYGGLNGCGGLEAIYNQSAATTTDILNDTYGHVEGTYSGSFTWNPTRYDGYGVLPGTATPSAITGANSVAALFGWRGHIIDPTGLYYLGARYYSPNAGNNFISPDPLGVGASMDLYSYCNGDPINNYDADGRCLESVGAITPQEAQNANYMVDKFSQAGTPIDYAAKSIALSYLDGHLDDSYQTPQSAGLKQGNSSQVYTVNGLFNNPTQAQDIADYVANQRGISSQSVIPLDNNTHGVLDLVRTAGAQMQLTDITALRAADMINYSNGGKIVAHSNGSAVIGVASMYLTDSARANISYTGVNPEWNIRETQYGFASASNIRSQGDIVSLLSPGNWFGNWQAVPNLNSWNPLYNHSLNNTMNGIGFNWFRGK